MTDNPSREAVEEGITLGSYVRMKERAEKAEAELAGSKLAWIEAQKSVEHWKSLYEGMGTNFGNRMAEHASHDAARAKVFEDRAKAAEQALAAQAETKEGK